MSSKFLEDPSTKKKIFTLVGCLCVAAVGWQLYHVLNQQPQLAKPIPLVRVTTINKSAVDNLNIYPGEVRGRYESNLGFQVPGKIISRQVNVGDTVVPGQILLTLDPQDIQEAVSASRSQVTAARAQYKLAADNVKRFEQLYASGAVSQASLDQYRTQLEAAAATLQQAESQNNNNANKLAYTQLRSDAAGVVAALHGEIGQVVSAGMPIATIVQNGEREIQIFVPENKVQQLQPGQKASISFWALPDTIIEGNISEIAPMADPLTRTYRVRVALSQLPPEVKLGMTAKVNLNHDDTQAMLLPASSIYQTNEQSNVWIVKEEKAHLTPVTVDGHQGNQVIITEGLQEGDVVVTAGAGKLIENQQVRVMESGEANEKG